MNTRPQLRRKLPLIMLALSTLMSGCAVSPLVSWTPPAYPTDGAVSMNYAMRYARSARDAYRTRLQDQIQNQGQLSAFLLGIGALATGAAAAHMHRDVYAGLAFGGATSYAYGQQNLRPERLRVYIAGVEAMDCAIAVVSPLDMSETDVTELQRQTEALATALSTQDGAMTKLRVAIVAIPGLSPGKELEAWNAQLSTSATLQASGQATANSGRDVQGKVKLAALALVNGVDRVRTEVDKAAVDTLPSLDAIGQAIASLPALTGRILPGANLEQRIRNAVGATAGAVGTSQSDVDGVDPSNPVKAAHRASAQLVKANTALAAAAARVNGLLAGVNPAASVAGLTQCKVAGVVPPLSVTQTELRFTGGKEETLSFVVSGGVPPYNGSLMTGGATGVTVRNPTGMDTRFDVTVAASVASGSFELLVQDRANGSSNNASVAIQVGAGTATPTTTNSTTSTTPTTLEEFGVAIAKVEAFSVKPDSHAYKRGSNELSADKKTLTTTLLCTVKTGKAAETEVEVRTALVATAKLESVYKDLFGTDEKKFKLKTTPTTCMTPTP